MQSHYERDGMMRVGRKCVESKYYPNIVCVIISTDEKYQGLPSNGNTNIKNKIIPLLIPNRSDLAKTILCHNLNFLFKTIFTVKWLTMMTQKSRELSPGADDDWHRWPKRKMNH